MGAGNRMIEENGCGGNDWQSRCGEWSPIRDEEVEVKKQMLSTPIKHPKPEIKNQMPVKKARSSSQVKQEAVRDAVEAVQQLRQMPSKPPLLERELTYGELYQAEQEAHKAALQKFNAQLPPVMQPLVIHPRLCQICYLPNVRGDAPAYQTYCDGCYKAKKDFERAKPKRECRTCRRLEVFADEPDYKLDCNGCYVARLRHQEEIAAKTEKRPCAICNQWIILVTEPAYKTTCNPCYIKKRKEDEEGPQRECSYCHYKAIPESEPEWKTMCKRCFISMKKNY